MAYKFPCLLFISLVVYQDVSALTTAELSTLRSSGLMITEDGEYYTVTSDGIPDHTTGNFPNADNPNDIQTQSHSYKIPKTPSKGSESCLPGGPIGFAANGIPFYSPYTFQGENAVEGQYAEVFDSCAGHPDQQGVYHYHKIPNCISHSSSSGGIVGVAMDGYPIYSVKDSNGKELSSSDLDDCHGRDEDGSYRYHLTNDFPYIIGCYYGKLHDDVAKRQSGPGCKKAVATETCDDCSDGATSLVSIISTICMLVFASIFLH